jgi:hypothetical protein
VHSKRFELDTYISLGVGDLISKYYQAFYIDLTEQISTGDP